MNTPSTLDSFESALLAELREHVATRPAPAAPAPEAPRRRHPRRWVAGLAAAAAAATAYVVVSPGGPAVSPAYAIDENADGDVVVTVHRLEDASGLEAALREHGIDAEVSFDPSSQDGYVVEAPDGTTPTPGHVAERGTVDNTDDASSGRRLTIPEGTGELDAADCGEGEPATLAQQGNDWVLTIPAGSPLQDREVRITTSADGDLLVAYPGEQPNSYCAVASAPMSE